MKHFRRHVVVSVSLVILLIAGYFLVSRGYNYFLKQIYPLKYTEIVEKESTDSGLDPALVYAVIKAESGFDPNAVSHAGAIGLMQLTPDTFDWIQSKSKNDPNLILTEDIYSPSVNIRYGCKLLKLLLEKYSDQRTAISAYNAGIGTVNGWLKDGTISKDGVSLDRIPYAETSKYVDSVLDNYKKYKNLYQFNSKGEIMNG